MKVELKLQIVCLNFVGVSKCCELGIGNRKSRQLWQGSLFAAIWLLWIEWTGNIISNSHNSRHRWLVLKSKALRNIWTTSFKSWLKPNITGGGVMGYWGSATGWGSMFTTLMGSSFQAFAIELLEWGHMFSGLESMKVICLKVTKMGFIIGHKIDPKHTIIPTSD